MDNYPLLNLFWTMLWFFLFIAWLWVLFSVFADIVRSKDLSGWAKALWALLIMIVPLLGVLIYIIARGTGMTERGFQIHQQREEAFRSYVRDAASTGPSTADELTKLAQLRDANVITNEEFDAQKAKLLAA
ncbi:SHOCT domain-containing protein [Phytoactinopolyspora limicola]|uniref:SHOCT domain-containing protein n=1 Tax=Phytoactinopolyspora limicola TaxID=2715536 RepID=UPI00140C5CD1|nr:SHOCT domain-containing protein [Phytoactinopolyspora limicola]